MNFKHILLVAGTFFLNKGCLTTEKNTFREHSPAQEQSQETLVNDYCFDPSPSLSLGIQRTQVTTQGFLRRHDDVEAVINGVYFGTDLTPLGVAYVSRTEYANGNRKQARGYFSIDKRGIIRVTESLPNKNNYKFVIGTHPLLVTAEEVHSQAKEKRYADHPAFRSAIGTKGGNVCFAVSRDSLEMKVWAELLENGGYKGALNLDGGPISQLTVRKKEGIYSYGPGFHETQLVIFSYHLH